MNHLIISYQIYLQETLIESLKELTIKITIYNFSYTILPFLNLLCYLDSNNNHL